MLAKNMIIPKLVINRIGLTLNDVIPSTAKAIIFLRGYFDSPAKRSLRSYSTTSV